MGARMARPFHLGWFLQGSSVQAWGEPWTGHIGRTWMVPELFTDLARSLERACFDYVLIEDSSYVGESYGGSTELYLKNGIAVPRQDPSVVASLMTQVTSRIGIVPTFGTYRLSAVFAGAPDGDTGPGVVGARRMERGHRKFRFRGDEFRPAGHAGARPALRHGRRIHGSLPAALEFLGAGRDRRGSGERRAGRSYQSARGQFRGAVLQDARPVELRAVPAGTAGDRSGGRVATRAAVRVAVSRTRSSPIPRGSRR